MILLIKMNLRIIFQCIRKYIYAKDNKYTESVFPIGDDKNEDKD